MMERCHGDRPTGTRVATLEQKLEHLADKVDASPSQDVNAWIDQIHGTFQNDSTYRQAARLGRQWDYKQRSKRH
jgi:hypothetical protein